MKRPNFLFIMTDTQATNMVGCYSGKPLNTQILIVWRRKVFALIPPTPVHRFVRLHAPDYLPVSTLTSPARGPTTSRQAKTSPLWGATLRMPAITPVTSANGISTVMTISALASVRRSGTLITGSMGRTTLAN